MNETLTAELGLAEANFAFTLEHQKEIYDALVNCFNDTKCKSNAVSWPYIKVKGGCEKPGINPIQGVTLIYNARLVDVNTRYASNYTKIDFQSLSYPNYNVGSYSISADMSLSMNFITKYVKPYKLFL